MLCYIGGKLRLYRIVSMLLHFDAFTRIAIASGLVSPLCQKQRDDPHNGLYPRDSQRDYPSLYSLSTRLAVDAQTEDSRVLATLSFYIIPFSQSSSPAVVNSHPRWSLEATMTI